MKKSIAVIALVISSAAALACEDSVTFVAPTPTPFGERVPASVAELPEGTLLVQDENPIGYPRVFAVGGDGAEQIGKGPSISVSPDGRAFAAIERDSDYFRWRIRLMGSDAEEQAVIELPPARTAINSGIPYLLWSSDGERLAYARPDSSQTDKSDVYVVNSDGSDRRRLTSAPDYYSLIGWASDGRFLISAPGRLSLVGEATEELPLPADLAQGGSTLSPDGTMVAIQTGDYEQGLELWLLDLHSRALRLLADMGGNVRARAQNLYVSAGVPQLRGEPSAALRLKGPAPVMWSPDSMHIAYDRLFTDAAEQIHSELRVVDVGSGEDVSISKEGFQPSWSPDGRYLAAPTGAGIVIHENGENRKLEIPAGQAIWSRSGTLLAISAGGTSLIDPETGAVHAAVTDYDEPAYGGLAAYGSWVWSPSGRYLAYSTTSDQFTKGSVYVLDTNTGAATLLLDRQAFLPVGWLAGD